MYVVEFYLEADAPAAVLVSRTPDLSGAVATAEQRKKLATARPAVLAGPLPDGRRAFWLASLRRRQLGIPSTARSGLYAGRPCILIHKSPHDGRPSGAPLGPFPSLAAAGRFLGRKRRDVGVALRTGRGCAGYYVLDATDCADCADRSDRGSGGNSADKARDDGK